MGNRRGALTRDRILESSMEALSSEGAISVSVRQVAKAAGLTPMAIYRHFEDKSSLEIAMLDRAFALFEDYLSEGSKTGKPGDDLIALAGRFFDFALEREPHFRFLFLSGCRPLNSGQGSVVGALSRPTFLLLRDALEEWSGTTSAGLKDLNQTTIDMLAFCVGQAALVLSGNLSYTRKRAKRELMSAFTRYLNAIAS